MTAEELLEAAGRLLVQPNRSMRRCWQRGCACLIRVALEQAIRDYWQTVSPEVADCAMRHQLLALPRFANREVAVTARATWYELSRAVHHHTYELAPTAAELQRWRNDVLDLLPRLTSAGGNDRSSRCPRGS